jgi:hypothetical protein
MPAEPLTATAFPPPTPETLAKPPMPLHKKIAWAGLVICLFLGLVPAWKYPYEDASEESPEEAFLKVSSPDPATAARANTRYRQDRWGRYRPIFWAPLESEPSQIGWPRTLLPMGLVAVVTMVGVFLTGPKK